jgi:hypothetical protein
MTLLIFCEQGENVIQYDENCELVPVNEVTSLKEKQVFDKYVSQYGLFERLFTDNHTGNVCAYNGNLVCIDMNLEHEHDTEDLDYRLRCIDIDELFKLYDIDPELICDSYYEKQVS